MGSSNRVGSGRGKDTQDGDSGDAAPLESTEITTDRLYDELSRTESDDSGSKGVRLTPEQQSEVILDDVLRSLFDDPNFQFDEAVVKENLDEILLLLISHRSSGTHGKGVMGDLAAIFDTRLSPGTVYPRLHELEDDGLLRVQELVRTKEYRIEDESALAERVVAAMEQHLALGYFFQSALAELLSESSNVDVEI